MAEVERRSPVIRHSSNSALLVPCVVWSSLRGSTLVTSLCLQVNGHVVVTYDIGNGPQTIVEDAQRFNDGQYHYVTFVRRRGDATLRVDDYPQNNVKPGDI